MKIKPMLYGLAALVGAAVAKPAYSQTVLPASVISNGVEGVNYGGLAQLRDSTFVATRANQNFLIDLIRI